MTLRKFLPFLLLAAALPARAQQIVPVSVRDLAAGFGIEARFLDDTMHFVHYIDTLAADNPARTDTCVSFNSRLMTLQNAIRYDYSRRNDTVWIDAGTYVADYDDYSRRIDTLSALVLRYAHRYIEREHIRKDSIQTTAINLVKDSIHRFHRTIINACEGIGRDKNRKAELNDVQYSYLAVYNRYDFSMKRGDSAYLADLDRLSEFQQHLIAHVLGNDNYTARINNFSNTLKLRCGSSHTDVLRSYQRYFRQRPAPIAFSTIDEYYEYAGSQEEIQETQECYIRVIELREQLSANSKRITSLYTPRFRNVAKTYQEVAATINTVPVFSTLDDANLFIADLEEFIAVQQCYIDDHARITKISDYGDTLARHCGFRYGEINRAYRQMSKEIITPPNYRTTDDAARYRAELDNIETLQRQYDSILDLRKLIDSREDTITNQWYNHFRLYNGYNSVRKQYVFTPSFIHTADGSRFIAQLSEFADLEEVFAETIRRHNRYKEMDKQISDASRGFSNFQRAYRALRKHYLTVKSVNHPSDLSLYHEQLGHFARVQEAALEKTKRNQLPDTDRRLKGIKEIAKQELILGL